MSIIAPWHVAEARGFSGGGRVSISRAYVAPRAYVAVRPMVVVRPRPVVIVRSPMIYRQPLLLPYVAPQTYVDPTGQGQAPVPVVAQGMSGWAVFWSVLFIVVGAGVVIACLVGCFRYGGAIFVTDPFDIFTDALIMDEIFDGGIY
jgi:hypothetical protein